MLRRLLRSAVIHGRVRKPGESVDIEGLDVHDLEHRGILEPLGFVPPEQTFEPPEATFTLPGPVVRKKTRRKKVTVRKKVRP